MVVEGTLIKMLNGVVADLAMELEALWMAEDLEEYRENNMARIDNALELASETLKVVPEEVRSKKTWIYDRGGEPGLIENEEDF